MHRNLFFAVSDILIVLVGTTLILSIWATRDIANESGRSAAEKSAFPNTVGRPIIISVTEKAPVRIVRIGASLWASIQIRRQNA